MYFTEHIKYMLCIINFFAGNTMSGVSFCRHAFWYVLHVNVAGGARKMIIQPASIDWIKPGSTFVLVQSANSIMQKLL